MALSLLLSVGGPVWGARETLQGKEDHAGSEIPISRNKVVILDGPDAALNAVFRIDGDGDPARQGVQLAAEEFRHPRFSFRRIDVEADATLFINRRQASVTNYDYPEFPFDYGSFEGFEPRSTGTAALGGIRIFAGRELTIRHIWDNHHLLVGDGSVVLLEPDSTLRLVAFQRRRDVTLRIVKGGELRGAGTLLGESPSLNPEARGQAIIMIDPFGVMAPGTPEQTGILRIGRALGESDNTLVKCEPQSLVRFRVNGPLPGENHDQILLNGNLVLDEAELELSSDRRLQRDDRVFLIRVESGDIEGHFHNFSQNSTVTILGPGGAPQKAKISYEGNQDKNSLTGGKDVVLYDFE